MEGTVEGNEVAGGRRRERNLEEDREGGRGNGGRQRDGEGKREGEEMMRKEKIKKRGEIGRRRGTGWQGGEVQRMMGNEDECSSDREERSNG